MLIDFPSNPIVNQVYKFEEGLPTEKSFIFKAGETGASDGYWSGFGQSGFGAASAAEIDAGVEAVKYIAPDQLELSKYLDPTKLQVILDTDSPIWRAGRKNLIMNGDMRIIQRGVGPFTGIFGGNTTADRWKIDNLGEAQVVSDTPSSRFGLSLDVRKGTAPNAAVQQGIELERVGLPDVFSIGNTFTISFWAKSVSAQVLSVYGIFRDLVNEGTGQIVDLNSTVSLTTGWDKYEITYAVGVSPSPSHATYVISFAAQSTSDFMITGIQLEQVNPKYTAATEFEYRPIAEELALCQRFFQTMDLTWRGYAPVASHAYYNTNLFPTPMRSNPISDLRAGTVIQITGFSVIDITSNSCALNFTSTGTGTVEYRNKILDLDAEL